MRLVRGAGGGQDVLGAMVIMGVGARVVGDVVGRTVGDTVGRCVGVLVGEVCARETQCNREKAHR